MQSPILDQSNSTDQFVGSSPTNQERADERSTTHPRVRRRALTACQLCRVRKTKCDNKRPTCGYCSFQGMRCIYSDPVNRGSLHTRRPVDSNFSEPRGNVLEKKLDRALALLEDLRSRGGPIHGQDNIDQDVWPESPEIQLNGLSPSAAIDSAFSDDGFGQLKVSALAARTSSCESLLAWPAFQGIVTGFVPKSFVFQAPSYTDGQNAPSLNQNDAGRSIVYEGSLWPLCKRFLSLIHVKNPVLDESKFKQYVREASETGPGWDGPGCLVVCTPYISQGFD